MLVLGTANRKKGHELAQLLAPVAIPLKTLADFPEGIDVVEDGERSEPGEGGQRKGDGANLCEAPFGSFRQISPAPFSFAFSL